MTALGATGICITAVGAGVMAGVYFTFSTFVLSALAATGHVHPVEHPREGPGTNLLILNWSWLGYNIAFGPFADQGLWGVLPFIPLLLYMFLHINYVEELYFRRSKKMVLVWALIHIAMGIKVHMALMLIPVGFLFKYIYDKKGLNDSFAMHFGTNILVVLSLFLSFIS